MTSLQQQLTQLGLTPNQSLVYLALFRVGEEKAGALIKLTGLHRHLVYVSLQELEEKKLITHSILRGIAMYKALAPARLLTRIHEQERLAQQVIEELGQTNKKSHAQEIVIYQGIDEFRRHAIRTYSTVPSHRVMRYLGISPEWYDVVGPTLEAELIRIQKQRKIQMRALAKSPTQGDRDYLEKTLGLSQIKTNPLISSDTSGVEILDNRISIRSFIEPYFVVEITHPQLAKNYQNYFDFLWKQKASRKI